MTWEGVTNNCIAFWEDRIGKRLSLDYAVPDSDKQYRVLLLRKEARLRRCNRKTKLKPQVPVLLVMKDSRRGVMLCHLCDVTSMRILPAAVTLGLVIGVLCRRRF